MQTRLFLLSLAASAALAQSSREMNDLDWMEFRELVPRKIDTRAAAGRNARGARGC